jgi:hypothetical protein
LGLEITSKAAPTEFPEYQAIHGDHKCKHCPADRYELGSVNPDYCSCRNAIAEVEAVVIERYGWREYLRRLAIELDTNPFLVGEGADESALRINNMTLPDCTLMITVPAVARAEACRAVIEAEDLNT